MKELRVEAARENLQLGRVEAALNPALPIFLGVYKNGVELAVKPMHVAPGHAFQKTVFGQNPDVLREIGVINSAGLKIEHLGCEQRCETDRPRSADDHFGESLPLNVIEHLQNRRKT